MHTKLIARRRKSGYTQLKSFLKKKQRAPLVRTLTIAKAAKQLADRDVAEANQAIGSIQVSLSELQKKYQGFGRRSSKLADSSDMARVAQLLNL